MKIIAPLLLLSLASCFGPGKPVHISGKTMGTTYNVKYRHQDGVPSREAVAARITELLNHLNGVFSTYIKHSEISRFNRDKRTGQWISVDPELHFVTRHALEVAGKTAGAFDPTLGPLVNLWGFGPGGKKDVPTKAAIKAARLRSGYDKLKLKEGAIKKLAKGIYLDLSALAKGYAVDRIGQLLASFHADEYMVEIGGEILTAGKWTIGLASPREGVALQKALKLTSGALATSGDYRNYFESEGKKYAHIIDTNSGRPVVSDVTAVSVYDPKSCMNADAMATALMAMGFDKGLAFAKRHKLAALFVRWEGDMLVEKGTGAFVQMFGE